MPIRNVLTREVGRSPGDKERPRRWVGQGQGEGEGDGLAYYMLRGSAAATSDGDEGEAGPSQLTGLSAYSLSPPDPPPGPTLTGLIVYSLPTRPADVDPSHFDHEVVSEEKDYTAHAAATATTATTQYATNSTDPDPSSPSRVVSPRMNVTHLRDGGNFDVFSLEEIHEKSSIEKDGINQENPTRWLPTDDEVEGAPRVPDGDEEGAIDCETNDGSFGYSGDYGGVQVRYQYEITEDVTKSETGLTEILPAVERRITELILPVFFGEECLDKGDGRVRRKGWRGLRAPTGDGRRRLTKVVGIDSRPDDFPLWDQECEFPIPHVNGRCYVIEGAMTLYFPPNHDVDMLVTGAQLSTLNALREGMDYSHIVQSHPAILKLKFLESSYSLRAVISPELQMASRGGVGGGMIAMIVIILLLLICLVCVSLAWRRREAKKKMEAEKAEKKRKRKKKASSDTDNDDDEDASRERSKPSKSSSSRVSKDSTRAFSDMVAPSSLQLIKDLKRAAEMMAGDDAGSESSSVKGPRRDRKKKKKNNRKTKKDRKKRKKKKKKEKKNRKASSAAAVRRNSARGVDPDNDNTDTDNTDTDNTTKEITTASSSTSNGSAALSDSDSSHSSTTSSDRGSATEGSTSTSTRDRTRSTNSTSDEDKGTTSTSTSDDDGNDSTTTSTSDSEDDKDESDEYDEFAPLPGSMVSHSNFMNQRRDLRQQRRLQGRGGGQGLGGGRGGLAAHMTKNNNLVISGAVEGDDNASEVTGVTGVHSLASVATAQVKNKTFSRPLSGFFGAGDDASVMTGISAATRPMSNARRSFSLTETLTKRGLVFLESIIEVQTIKPM
ncbi:hypothetical protein ACHAXA_000608 [Cyclostephanos tholiformis]|uniref:Transmembrane protein n=1 Tax=Cyclostephanos tholiformis TaxID=382380 RepID=A0ABD3SQG3_9STRA